jgi:hypothetical protein
MIVVDTLARMRKSPKAGASVYHEDLEAIAPLHWLARKWHCVVMLVDHQRKASADDIFDSVTGSLAKTGTVDGTWILERVRNQSFAKLSITGRDIEESERLLSFDSSRGLWGPVTQEATSTRLPKPQQQILRALEPRGVPKTNAEIASFTGTSTVALKRQLLYLERDGYIERHSYGKWVYPALDGEPTKGGVPSVPSVPGVLPVPTVLPSGAGSTVGTPGPTSTGGTLNSEVEIESCPECGAMWPGLSSISCSECGFTGHPVKVGYSPAVE